MTHTPVLVHEILDLFNPQSSSVLLDVTLGMGGHTQAFLDAAPGSRVVGLDADEHALEQAKKNLAAYGSRVTYLNANFAQLKDSIQGGGIVQPSTLHSHPPFTHILFDLGVGSHQLADTKRGYSFRAAGPLRMRYGLPARVPAYLRALNRLERVLGYQPEADDIVARLPAADIAEVIRFYGEERYAGRISQAIKRAAPIRDAAALAACVTQVVPGRYRHARLHPATRTFLALRLAVNRELEALQAALPQALDMLAPRGRLAVISFHSLEDRLAKLFFRHVARADYAQLLTKKPLQPAPSELAANSRARSAKLRSLVKTETARAP